MAWHFHFFLDVSQRVEHKTKTKKIPVKFLKIALLGVFQTKNHARKFSCVVLGACVRAKEFPKIIQMSFGVPAKTCENAVTN